MKVQLNRISYGLPTKAFFIDYTVSQKRQLPVVKEFIIRILHSIGSSQVSLLQNYFGFTASEMKAVLDDLMDESLIKWNDDEIELTTHALENFEEVEGSMLPRFFEVVDKTDTVFFELSEFRMLPKTIERGGLNGASISLSLADDCFEKLNDKASSAFDSNFEHFRESVKGEDIYSDREELYKINHVNGKYDLSTPIPVEYYIDTNAPNVLQTAYESSAIDEWDTSKSLFNYMDAAISQKTLNFSEKDFSDYLNATNDPVLIKYWNDSNSFLDTDLLLRHHETGTANHSKDTQLIIGNLYTDFNCSAILQKLKEVFDQKPKSSGLIWLTHAESGTWGRTKELGAMIESITALFDKRKKTSEAVLVIPSASKQESFNQRKIYSSSSAHLMDCESRFGGNSCEVLLIPNIMIACLHHAPLSDERNISLPIGYISFDSEFIDSVSRNIFTWAATGTKFNHHFERRDTESKDMVLNKYFSPILSQGQVVDS